VITIESCLQAINSENVCGENLEYDPAFIALEQAIKGKPEQQIGTLIQEAEPPNWREIKRDSAELLTRTIDLRVLICYLRSVIALEGFSGLAEGLPIIQALVTQRWDSIYPQLDPDDDNDPTERINILMSLCDNSTMLRPLSQLPLLKSKLMGNFNLREISIATGKAAPSASEKVIEQATIEAALQDSESDYLIQLRVDLTVSLDALNQLENVVTEKVGISNAPSFSLLRNFLKDSINIVTEWHERKGLNQEIILEEEISDDVIDVDSSGTRPVVAKSVLAEINNNQDVLKALNLICDYYQKHEPSSPVPIFLERCKGLVGKSFLEVLEDIAPMGIEQVMMFKGQKNNP
jgi:type VI secretion system protein ImpA